MSIVTTTPVSSVIYNGTALPFIRHVASIVATATTGSTVIMTTPSGRTATVTEISGTWTFSGLYEMGVYSLTASLSGRSRTETVYVDSAIAYTVELNFQTFLYREGDQCTSITGGWRSYAYGIVSGYSAVAPTFNSDNITLLTTGDNISCATDSMNAVSVNNYSKLCADCISSQANPWMRFGIRTANTGNYDGTFTAILGDDAIPVATRVTIELSLSGITGSFYIFFGLHRGFYSITIHNIWLEE